MTLPAKRHDSLQAAFAAEIQAVQAKYRLMGMGGAIAVDGVEVAAATAGRTRRRSRVPTTTDRWHIGSVTKPVTSTLIGLLIEEGHLEFESCLGDVLSGFKEPMHETWKPVTIHQLLTHTHGGPANFSPFTMLSRSATTTELLDERRRVLGTMLAKPLAGIPGTSFGYSNVGYTLVAYVAEQLLADSYESLMQQRVFAPLNMTSVGFGPPPARGPVGHRQILGMSKSIVPGKHRIADNGPVMSAAGRAHMTLSDLLSFGNHQVQALNRSAGALFTPEMAAELTTCVPASEEAHYACGWVNGEDPDGRRILWHNGSNLMWTALLVVLPKERIVFAYASNVGAMQRSEQAFKDVSRHMMTLLA